MKPRVKILSACFSFLIAGVFYAEAAYPLAAAKTAGWTVKLTGYVKNIATYTEPSEYPTHLLLGIPENPLFPLGNIERDEHWENYTRLRLRMNGRRGGRWAWELHYEMRGLALNPDFTLASFLDGGSRSEQWLSLDARLYDEPGYEIEHMLDRAWMRWTPKWGEIVVGRQAITWTSGKLWYPTDLFGPFLPFDIDQDEKRGVDASNIAINLGSLSSFRMIYAPLENRDDARVGARLKTTLAGFDIHLMGGYFVGDRVGGGSLAHNLFGAVMRAEAAYTHPLRDDDRWSMVVNADAGLPHNVYVAVEYFHQSEGAKSKSEYWRSTDLFYRDKLHGLAQDYAGCILTWSATPLLTPGLSGVVNLLDTSFFVGPSVKYKPMENVTLTAAANIFTPHGSDSEYGLYPNTYYASVKAFF